ncbi:MAG: hypothetical protein WCS62_05060 [Bacilli bacterium]
MVSRFGDAVPAGTGKCSLVPGVGYGYPVTGRKRVALVLITAVSAGSTANGTLVPGRGVRCP